MLDVGGRGRTKSNRQIEEVEEPTSAHRCPDNEVNPKTELRVNQKEGGGHRTSSPSVKR